MDFLVEIITPKGIYYSDKVTSLTIKLTSGYRTFLAGHTPLIGTLSYAPMHIIKDGITTNYAVHGGAINVTKEKMTVICNAIESEKEIDLERANAAMDRAKMRLESKDPEIDQKRAQLALEKALVRIQVASRN